MAFGETFDPPAADRPISLLQAALAQNAAGQDPQLAGGPNRHGEGY